MAIALTVASRTTGSQWDISIPVTVTGVLAHALLLQDIVTQINYTHWSIATEFQLYFGFPVFLLLFKR